MKKTIIAIATALVASLACISANAQNTVEHNLKLGAGLSIADHYNYRGGLGLSASYGLDIFANRVISFLPEIGVRAMSESIIRSGFEGTDLDDIIFADAAISAKLNLSRWSFGVGPFFSLTLNDDHYAYDYAVGSEPSISELSEFKAYDYGVQGMINYSLGKHLLIGAESHYGLRDMGMQYDNYSPDGNRHLFDLNLTMTFVF